MKRIILAGLLGGAARRLRAAGIAGRP